MLDTIGVTCPVGQPVDPVNLEAQGWTIHTVSNQADGISVFATVACQASGDARFKYFANAQQLNVEVSLPKLLKGDNSLLLSWPEVATGLVQVSKLAQDVLRSCLPPIEDWQVFRLDPVWAWPVNPDPYIAALHFGRLRGSQVAQEPGSVRWRSLRSGSIFARFYDKSHEAGHDVDLPTRFERQIRPKKQVVRVEGEQIGRKVSDLNQDTLLGLLREGASQVGIDKPVKSIPALRPLLIDALGKRSGSNIFRVLLEAREFGGFPSDLADATRRKYERQLKQAGVGMVSQGAELPGLVIGA